MALGCGMAGLVCLIVCLVKRSWKGALWTLGITGAAVGSMFGLMFLFYIGWQAPSLDRPVAPSELVGTWQLRDPSIAMVKNSSDEYKPGSETIYEIELKADGTCRYRSLLEWPARYVDCPGRWKITPSSNKSNTSQLNLDLDDSGSFYLDFGEEDGPFFLWTYWGDPDSGELLIYDRKPGS